MHVLASLWGLSQSRTASAQPCAPGGQPWRHSLRGVLPPVFSLAWISNRQRIRCQREREIEVCLHSYLAVGLITVNNEGPSETARPTRHPSFQHSRYGRALEPLFIHLLDPVLESLQPSQCCQTLNPPTLVCSYNTTPISETFITSTLVETCFF